MHIHYNGIKVNALDQLCLTTFLAQYGIHQHTGGLAVAVNEKVVARSEWEFIQLSEGDSIEVVYAVQGG